jgi:hypothetical protein
VNKGLFSSFLGKGVKIGRGGAESKDGLLLGAYETHIALYNEGEGVIYYQNAHIKSISQNAKKQLPYNEVLKTVPVADNEDFIDLMNSQVRAWVKINRGGPDKVEGILLEANPDFVTISSGDEIIYLTPFHIKSFSFGEKYEVYEQNNQVSQTYRRRK